MGFFGMAASFQIASFTPFPFLFRCDCPIEGRVFTLAFHPGGKWILSQTDTNIIHVWDAFSGNEVSSLVHDGRVVNSAAFSPDGKWVVSGSSDSTVRVWKTSTGQEILRITLNGLVYAGAFSPDGKWIVGSANGTEYVWEAATGREVIRLEHTELVAPLAFSPDGKWILTIGDEGTAWLWKWQPEDLVAEACRRLSRNLTHDEWQEYFGDMSYHLTCPNLPIPKE
jgi:WD40 repeat protein